MTSTSTAPLRLQNLVDGAWADARDGRVADVVDPATGEVYAHAPVSGPADVDAAVGAA
ncbi:gamma-aminobutyraldehyde dehydrogenase, partial [Cellulomonas hominis]|nr:gamma-aminobutyraldehyde dehydrogenase [Cellulomonas hominis]